MELLTLAFIAALSYALILMKVLGFQRFIRWQKPLDIIFTVGVPMIVMTSGTFSAIVLSVLSGFIFTVMTFLLSQINRIKIPA